MASGLQSWVEDHSNITMFNFIAYPIFSKHHDTDSKHPKKLSRAKILSLSLSFSFKRAQLSVTHSATKKKEKETARGSGFKMEWRKSPPMTMVWYCSKWKYKHPTTAAATNKQMSCVLIIYRSEWRLLHDSDLTLIAFWPCLFLFLCCFHYYFLLKRGRSVNCQLMFKMRIKALFFFFFLLPSLYTF